MRINFDNFDVMIGIKNACLTVARNVVEIDVIFSALIFVGNAEILWRNAMICCWDCSSTSESGMLFKTGAAEAA